MMLQQLSLFAIPLPRGIFSPPLLTQKQIKEKQSEEKKELEELKRCWIEIQKCADYIVEVVFENNNTNKKHSEYHLKIKKKVRKEREYLMNFSLNKEDVKRDFRGWLYVKIFNCAMNKKIWITLVKEKKFISLQLRVALFFKNFIRDEYRKFYDRVVLVEDFTKRKFYKTPRAATREVFNGFDPHNLFEEVRYDE